MPTDSGLTDLLASIERALRIGITIVVAYLVALWLASIWWTFRDIRARTTDLFLQIAATLLVSVFSFPGLLIYMILRPPKTLAQLYEESLEEEAFLQGIQVHNSCPVCKQRVEGDFIFCPWCQTRLKRTCTRCERPLMLRWKLCPFCGQAVYTAPGGGGEAVAAREGSGSVTTVIPTASRPAAEQDDEVDTGPRPRVVAGGRR